MYTETDLADVRQAIADLARGQRVTQIRAANGKTWQFQQATLRELRDIESLMQRSIDQAAGRARRTRTRAVITSKGL